MSLFDLNSVDDWRKRIREMASDQGGRGPKQEVLVVGNVVFQAKTKTELPYVSMRN